MCDCSVSVCVSGSWWTAGPVSWLSGWVGRSLWFPPMCWGWFTVRLWFGQERSFAPCCRSSAPSSLSSSSTARRFIPEISLTGDKQSVLFFPSQFYVSIMSLFTFLSQITLFYNCRPASKTFRSTTSTFFFVAVLLIGWALATAVMVYSLAE